MSPLKSINEIFQNMDSEDESKDIKSDQDELETVPQMIKTVIEEAILGQKIWNADFSADIKSQIFYSFWKLLKKNSIFGANYFKYYSDYSYLKLEKENDQPNIVFLIFDDNYSLTMLCAIVSTALAAGSPVIAEPQDKNLLDFRNLLLKAGLPKGMFEVVPHVKNFDDIVEINKIIFIGNENQAVPLYKKHCHRSFSFLNPNNTASLILESCDLPAALTKIINSTWGEELDQFWGISTIIVQESIYTKFIKQLQFTLKNFPPKKYNGKITNQKKLQDIEKLILDAKAAGANIIKKEDYSYNFTFVLNYHQYDHKMFGVAINVMVCRTAKEGITMLNKNSFLGISVWTENYSEGLEIASKAVCNHIWINCHGCVSPNAPVYSSNFTLENYQDYREFKHFTFRSESENFKVDDFNLHDFSNKLPVIISMAEKSFEFWKCNIDKQSILVEAYNAFKKKATVLNFKSNISKFESFSKIISFSNTKCLSNDINSELDLKYEIIQKVVPVGIIALYIINIPLKHSNDFEEKFIEMLLLILLHGNGIILFGEIDRLSWILDIFKNNLPKNLIQVIEEKEAMFFLAENSNIQNFWILGENDLSNEIYGKLRNSWKTMNKSFICFSSLSEKKKIFELSHKKKVIWLPKAD